MRLGLLADIHEDAANLRAAIRELRVRQVDGFVMLGDVLDHGEHAAATVALLADLPGHAVWGNHDFGLCGALPAAMTDAFPEEVLAYFRGLRPWVEVEGRRFQHIDPHLDPERFEDLWNLPTPEERVAGFAGSPHARAFMGHLHHWAICTPKGYMSWNPTAPFRYVPGERYLTVVHAVVEGWCALLDTDEDQLEAVRLTAR